MVEFGGLWVEWVISIGVAEQLRKKLFKYINEAIHGAPSLIQNVEADAPASEVNIGMVDFVKEAD